MQMATQTHAMLLPSEAINVPAAIPRLVPIVGNFFARGKKVDHIAPPAEQPKM